MNIGMEGKSDKERHKRGCKEIPNVQPILSRSSSWVMLILPTTLGNQVEEGDTQF